MKAVGVTEAQVLEALRVIVRNQELPALNYAVNYAKAGISHPYGSGPMTGEELYAQVLYVQNNLASWRGPTAKAVKEILKSFVKQNRNRTQWEET